jgi:hypothetical protein
MTLQNKLEELHRVKLMIESQDFQEYFCKPLREKQNELRLNFFSDSLKDAWKKGGKYQGIEEFFEILKQLNVDIKNTQDELES